MALEVLLGKLESGPGDWDRREDRQLRQYPDVYIRTVSFRTCVIPLHTQSHCLLSSDHLSPLLGHKVQRAASLVAHHVLSSA